jgi:hypothetical protein
VARLAAAGALAGTAASSAVAIGARSASAAPRPAPTGPAASAVPHVRPVTLPAHAGLREVGVSTAPHATPAGGRQPAVLHRVPRAGAHRSVVNAGFLSTNWSGEVVTGGTYSGVSGQWTVPAVVPSVAARYSASWIGVDGTSASSLIQTGTSQSTVNGQTDYSAWFELLPNAPTYLAATVTPGDVIQASVSETAPGAWNITIQDPTAGWHFSRGFTYSSPGLSVEWIEEAPTVNGGQSALADFTSVPFTQLGVTVVDPGTSDTLPIYMSNPTYTAIIAYPGTLDTVHGAFTDYYGSPPPGTGPPLPAHGYDLVGSDGGVFVFGGGFYGSLPGIGVTVDNITGIVATSTHTGYFLVGSDGGVFAFNAPFANSLPGIGVRVNDIVGIVPTLDDQGYFLVGSDGGVFSFNAPFANSLPGIGVHVNDIVGIAATADDQGYWVLGSNGAVYAFGDATWYGNAPSGAVGITATTDGGGYWIVGGDGAVSAFGDATDYGDLPGLGVAVDNVVAIVVSADGGGYNLFGSDGGVFSFGDAANIGSLPGLGVRVDNIVGAVPT